MSDCKISGFEKYKVYDDGAVRGATGRFLKPWVGRGGYLKVCLSNGGKRRWAYLHRLVGECFISNPLSKPEINHINGDKLDNNVENLEWVTRLENNVHAFKHRLRIGKRGEDNTHSKLSEKDVTEIRSLRGNKTQRELATRYGVTHSHISKIQRNVKWGYALIKEVV